MEFMSILVRNNVAQQKYIFSNGKFDNFKDQYIMPYMANLKDIYQAAQMSIKPSHTLPNSIRYMLETIYRFEGSVGKLDDYLLKVFVVCLLIDLPNNAANLFAFIDNTIGSAIRHINASLDRAAGNDLAVLFKVIVPHTELLHCTILERPIGCQE